MNTARISLGEAFRGLSGVEVLVSEHLTERVLYPRSVARARRRARLGHRQHQAERPRMEVLVLEDAGVMVMHPAMFAQLKARLR